MNDTEKFLQFALDNGALEIIPEGRQLKSGRMSPYFFNSGLFRTGQALNVLLNAYRYAWDRHPILKRRLSDVDVIFGPAYKGIPLAVGLTLLDPTFWHLGYAFDRKEEKDHGEGGKTVGASMDKKKVIIIDDVMTSGLSSAEAVETVRTSGGTPEGVLLAFDRQEVGQDGKLSAVEEFEQKFEIPVAAAATLEDLLAYLRKIEHPAVLSIETYRAQYGVFGQRQEHIISAGPTVGRAGTSFSNASKEGSIDEGREHGPLPG